MTKNLDVRQEADEAGRAGTHGEGLALYHAAHSTCSQKVRLCLAEKGLRYESRILEIRRLEHISPEYLAINPNGVVPTLTHQGAAVIDSSVICEYLDEVFTAQPLSPANPLERARMRTWLRYLEEAPTAAIRIPSINALFVPIMRELGRDWERARDEAPLRKHLYRRIGEAGFDPQEVEDSVESLRQTLERVERAMAAGPWLIGEMFSLADIVLAPTLVRMEDLKLSTLWADLPGVSDWYHRLTIRPSFQRAFFPGTRLTRTNLEEIV